MTNWLIGCKGNSVDRMEPPLQRQARASIFKNFLFISHSRMEFSQQKFSFRRKNSRFAFIQIFRNRKKNAETKLFEEKNFPPSSSRTYHWILRPDSPFSPKTKYLLTTEGRRLTGSSPVTWICEKIARSTDPERTNGVR